MKTKTQRDLIIKLLKKTPIVQIVCERVGVSRATYYRWRKSNEKFKEQTDEAIAIGASLVNDMAESQLISAIKDKNLTAIIFWLKNHHRSYKTKVELSGAIKTTGEKLTPEQEEAICQALKLANLNTSNNPSQNDKSIKSNSNSSNNKRSKGKTRGNKK